MCLKVQRKVKHILFITFILLFSSYSSFVLSGVSSFRVWTMPFNTFVVKCEAQKCTFHEPLIKWGNISKVQVELNGEKEEKPKPSF